jgi:hypothetical protein
VLATEWLGGLRRRVGHRFQILEAEIHRGGFVDSGLLAAASCSTSCSSAARFAAVLAPRM